MGLSGTSCINIWSYSVGSQLLLLKTIRIRWINIANAYSHRKSSRLIRWDFTALQKKWFMISVSGQETANQKQLTQ